MPGRKNGEGRLAANTFRHPPFRRLWMGLLVLTSILWLVPERSGLIRLYFVVAVPVLLGATSWVLWPRRWLRLVPLVVIAVTAVVVSLPGRPYDPQSLRTQYVRCLRRYVGTLYVWGGETRLGIDCSGLVRRGLVDAFLLEGVRTWNGRLVRAGLDHWWHDLSAKAMQSQHQQRTQLVFSAPSINEIDHTNLQPGDLAITSNGVHALAYLGQRNWIEADPEFLRVVSVHVPSKDNLWFNMSVDVLCWRELAHERRHSRGHPAQG
ncbi:MAG: C40 family peptidase [Armatimonadetes bacterium]|nr:C40 family peptidase [Armatimonadota bacterium]